MELLLLANGTKRTIGRNFRMLVTMVKKKLLAPGGRTIGEFVLVVLGVLVALMVDTWIEQRNDDNLRQEYLTSLTDDLKTDQQILEYRISFFTAVYSFGLETLNFHVSQVDVAVYLYATRKRSVADILTSFEHE